MGFKQGRGNLKAAVEVGSLENPALAPVTPVLTLVTFLQFLQTHKTVSCGSYDKQMHL